MTSMQTLCMDSAGETGEVIFRTPCSVGSGGESTWMSAFDAARNDILNDRGPLEGEGMSIEQTNAVLGILDDHFMKHLRRNSEVGVIGKRKRNEVLAEALNCGAFQNDGAHGIPANLLVTFEVDELMLFVAKIERAAIAAATEGAAS